LIDSPPAATAAKASPMKLEREAVRDHLRRPGPGRARISSMANGEVLRAAP